MMADRAWWTWDETDGGQGIGARLMTGQGMRLMTDHEEGMRLMTGQGMRLMTQIGRE